MSFSKDALSEFEMWSEMKGQVLAYQKCVAVSLLHKGRRNGMTMKTRCIQDTHFIIKFRFDTLAQTINQVCVKRNVQFKLFL